VGFLDKPPGPLLRVCVLGLLLCRGCHDGVLLVVSGVSRVGWLSMHVLGSFRGRAPWARDSCLVAQCCGVQFVVPWNTLSCPVWLCYVGKCCAFCLFFWGYALGGVS